MTDPRASGARSPELNPPLLFLIANLSIFMIGLGFAVRANIAANNWNGYAVTWAVRRLLSTGFNVFLTDG